jgi:hypothetical protein
MKKKLITLLTIATALLPWALRAQETNQVNDQTKQLTDETKQVTSQTSPWTVDLSLYGVAAGMSGDVTVHF